MGCEVKEVSDFYNIYAQYIPNCSILVSAERKNKRFYGELFCKHNGSYKIRGDDLYLNNLSANFENLIKPKKLYIHGQELFETPPRENLECLTKAGYAIYKL